MIMQCSIVNKTQISETKTFRLDAEYFEPKYLKLLALIEKKSAKFIRLQELNLDIDASAFYPALEPYYNQGELPFLRVQDIDKKIDYDSCIKIPENITQNKSFDTLKVVNIGDIVITKGGSIARIGLVTKKSAACRDLIFINSSTLNDIGYKFLYVYCLTYIYKNFLIRSSSMTAQPHLTLTFVKEIPIFNPNEQFKKFIVNLYNKIEKFDQKSKKYYELANSILVQDIGLDDLDSKPKLSYIKKLSNTQKVGRIDAEYFHPKYDEIINKIKLYPNGWDTLNNLIRIRDNTFSPQANVSYDYIELANITTKGKIVNVEKIQGKYLPTRARRVVKTSDVIVSSVEGSLDSIALITPQYNNALCSTGFYVMYSDEYNSETLFCLMKSILGQCQLKRGCSGTILTAINNDELSKIVLPRINKKIQEEIKQYISQIYAYQSLSKQLLETAIRGVEKAIEENEEVAIQWMNEQLENIGVSL